MLRTKWKYIALGFLFAFAIGKTADAAEAVRDFFWSDAVPMPSCSEGVFGYVIDGKRVVVNLPSCEEAKKNRVLVLVNGKYLHNVEGTVPGKGAPFIENGRTMVPLRAIADAFGFEVDWEPAGQKITLTKDGKKIVMQVGKPEMSVDGEKVNLAGAAPVIKNDVTFLPVRPLAEILSIKVDWDGNTRTATFTAG